MIFHLNKMIGWGYVLHIKTEKGQYFGDGRCILEEPPYKIINKKPSRRELKGKINVSGHCSQPYIKLKDILIYEDEEGNPLKFRFVGVKYYRDPHDMFIGKIRLIREKYPLLEKLRHVLNF